MNQRAKAALDGSRFEDIRWVSSTGSTNEDLAHAARRGAGECALIADHQSAGRGRLGRSWEAPPGASMLLSVLLRGALPPTGPHLLTVALAVAVAESLEAATEVPVGLKWPNDVIAVGAGDDGGDRKLGGLLAEFVPASQQRPGPDGTAPTDAVVLGVGVNLAWSGTGFPAELADSATSLDLLGAEVNRDDLAVAVLSRMEPSRELGVSASARSTLLEIYRSRCTTMGRRVRVELPGGARLLGRAVDVAEDASLVVRDDGGRDHVVSVGDVVHLRPED